MKILLACLVSAGVALPAFAASQIRTSVVASGGDRSAGAARRLHGSAGQGATGVSGNATHVLRHGYWNQGGLAVVDVPVQPGPVMPRTLAFGAPAPNPSRGATTFALSLPRAAGVEVAVFDLGGRRVRTLAAGTHDAGEHAIGWDGRDAGGQPAPAGLYFARAVVDGRALAERRVVRIH